MVCWARGVIYRSECDLGDNFPGEKVLQKGLLSVPGMTLVRTVGTFEAASFAQSH